MKRRDPHDPSTLFIVLRLGAVLWALAVGLPGMLLLIVGDSQAGLFFAALALTIAALPWLTITAVFEPGRRSVVVGCLAWLAGGLLCLQVIRQVPTGIPPADSRVTSEYARGSLGFQRYALGNLLPEGDQLALAFSVLPFVDSLFTQAQASRLKKFTAGIYRELEADAGFHALGSVMSETYGEISGSSYSAIDHAYVYVPKSLDRTKPARVLVFFHGSGGNFKAYLWILSQVAERAKFVLVAPSAGMGNWTGTDSWTAVDRALEAADRRASIDHRRVAIMGLSNGGRAVSQLAVAPGRRFESLILVSPVFDDLWSGSEALKASWRSRPVLVVTGALDDRVPLSYVQKRVAEIQERRSKVRFETFPDADHFLMFSHRAQLEKLLEEWLGYDTNDVQDDSGDTPKPVKRTDEEELLRADLREGQRLSETLGGGLVVL